MMTICKRHKCSYSTEINYNNKIDILNGYIKTPKYEILMSTTFDHERGNDIVTFDITAPTETRKIIICDDPFTNIFSVPINNHIEIIFSVAIRLTLKKLRCIAGKKLPFCLKDYLI